MCEKGRYSRMLLYFPKKYREGLFLFLSPDIRLKYACQQKAAGVVLILN